MPPKHVIRKIVKARILRRYRYGLLKKRTKTERIFEDILRDLGVGFIPQAGFLTSRSFYISDFYIKSPYKLLVEIDGKTHASKKERARDRQKIIYFKRCGFAMHRVAEQTLLEDPAKVKRQMTDRLSKLKMKRSALTGFF